MSAPARMLMRREWRGGKRLIFLAGATLITATALLALLLSLTETFEKTRRDSARALLGGDISLRLSQRDFSAAELAWLADNSAEQTRLRIARMLAVAGERAQLVRLKGVEENYPLFGDLPLRGAETTAPLFADAGRAAFIGADLAGLLDLRIGGTLHVGGLTLRVAGIVENEPDPDPRLWLNAPLVLVAKSAMEQGRFLLPGALVARHARFILADGDAPELWHGRLRETFPDAGWRVRDPDEAQSNARRVVNRMRDFLSLAALAAMILAGIGCGNAVSAFLRARIRAIAVIKMIGGEGRLVRGVYLTLTAAFAVGGALIGALIGGGLLYVVAPLLNPYLPWPLAAHWSAEAVARTWLTATAMTIAFALPPVLRFARVNPLILFAAGGNEDQAPPASARDRAIMAATFLFAAAALPLAWDKKIMLFAVAAVACLLYAAAILLTKLGERAGAKRAAALRLGFLALARNRRQTAITVMSFGVGVFILTAILNTEKNFGNRIDDTLRQTAPALYLVGALPDQEEELLDVIGGLGGEARTIPFLRGRISAIGGRSAAEIAESAEDERWILRGDRGFTWGDGSYIGGSYVTEGKLWDESISGLQASFDEEAAAAFGLSLGDALELNILGEPVTAIISSFREIDWQTFDVNFVVILSQAPFAGVPHTRMGAAHLPPDNVTAAQLAIGERLPNVVPIPTAPIFTAAKNLLARASALVKAIALFLLAAGLPMILATLIESRRHRQKNAATLRLLGAERRTVVWASVTEFVCMALLAVLPAAVFGALTGRVIVVNIFELSWQAHWQHVAGIAAAAVGVFLLLGVGDIARAAKQAPYPMLRNE